MSIKAILFDLNGTLLDMSPLDPLFKRIFAKPNMRERWFLEMQILWMTTIPTLTYQPFPEIAKAAAKILGNKTNVDMPRSDLEELTTAMQKLPPYVEVSSALEKLQQKGYRLAALTNGTKKAAKAQTKFAEIHQYFEDIFSADDVEQFKPGPKPYLYAAENLGLKPSKCLMVAAHPWDLQGAHAVGCSTAFIQRPTQSLNPLNKKPDYLAPDLWRLADSL